MTKQRPHREADLRPVESSQYIIGRNPVLEALEHHPEKLQKIYVQHGQQGEKVRRIYRLAKSLRIQISNADAGKFRKMVGTQVHQGVVGLLYPAPVGDAEDLLVRLPSLPSPLFLVIVDRIQDPHNLGAIIRSAEVFQATGLVFSARDSVPITETVVKASAGAALHLPLYKAGNLSQFTQALQQRDIWVYSTDVSATAPLWEVDFRRNCAVIIGNEEKGVRPGLLKHSDNTFRIPQGGQTESLNASVAAGIVFAESYRQRISGKR